MVQSIKDPDALAEAACRVDLIDAGIKDMIVAFRDVEAKTRSLLQIIEGKVKGHSIHFHLFLTALRSLPRLTRLASRLQASYGEFIMIQYGQRCPPMCMCMERLVICHWSCPNPHMCRYVELLYEAI